METGIVVEVEYYVCATLKGTSQYDPCCLCRLQGSMCYLWDPLAIYLTMHIDVVLDLL